MMSGAGVTPSGAKTCPLTISRSPGSDDVAMMPVELTSPDGNGVGGGPLWAATIDANSNQTTDGSQRKAVTRAPPRIEDAHSASVLTKKRRVSFSAFSCRAHLH